MVDLFFSPTHALYPIRFPKLKVLDNKEITTVERKRAEIVLKKEESILNMLFSNECLILKLRLVLFFFFSLLSFLPPSSPFFLYSFHS